MSLKTCMSTSTACATSSACLSPPSPVTQGCTPTKVCSRAHDPQHQPYSHAILNAPSAFPLDTHTHTPHSTYLSCASFFSAATFSCLHASLPLRSSSGPGNNSKATRYTSVLMLQLDPAHHHTPSTQHPHCNMFVQPSTDSTPLTNKRRRIPHTPTPTHLCTPSASQAGGTWPPAPPWTDWGAHLMDGWTHTQTDRSSKHTTAPAARRKKKNS